MIKRDPNDLPASENESDIYTNFHAKPHRTQSGTVRLRPHLKKGIDRPWVGQCLFNNKVRTFVLTSANKVNNFNLVVSGDRGRRPVGTAHDLMIQLDCDPLVGQFKESEKVGKRDLGANLF